jgi:two-component system, cell cycle response regulator CpdR
MKIAPLVDEGRMVARFTILFAEDDTAVRDVVVEILTEKGFRVLLASDGYEAVRLLAEHHVDLLLTDIVMPDMDGVQLARQAKVMRPRIKVLFTTGYAERAVERDARHEGRVLLKPMHAADLAREIETLLAAR